MVHVSEASMRGTLRVCVATVGGDVHHTVVIGLRPDITIRDVAAAHDINTPNTDHITLHVTQSAQQFSPSPDVIYLIKCIRIYVNTNNNCII